MDLSMLEHVGLVADGHGHDPDEVLAAARSWLSGHTALTPIGVREAIPITALPVEAWFGSYVVDDSNSEHHGEQMQGFVQEHHDGAAPVTVVNLPRFLTVTP